MNAPITIEFDAAGTGRCLYTETVDLFEIGRLEMRRASNVEFLHEAQVWQVTSNTGRRLYANASRAECLAWEQRNADKLED